MLASILFHPELGGRDYTVLGIMILVGNFNSNYDILSKLSLWSPGVSQLVDEQNILSSKDTQYLYFTGSMLSE